MINSHDFSNATYMLYILIITYLYSMNYLHTAHKTSCLSSGRLKDSTLDRPQFHSSERQKTSEKPGTKLCVFILTFVFIENF